MVKNFPRNKHHVNMAMDFSKHKTACKRRFDHIPWGCMARVFLSPLDAAQLGLGSRDLMIFFSILICNQRM
jgi:hypothetical protein